jgi:RNA polymerase sigma-70 factor (TIGR02960 family)
MEEVGVNVDPTIADGIARARAGDSEAFRQLTDPHRRELQLHCYRMLGSFQDAEDALQDTLLSAWQAIGRFEGRASVRTWLYSIATNRCLNARRTAISRRAKEWNVPGVEPPEPSRMGDIVWLQPFPDAFLAGETTPESWLEQAETMSLAFVTALQTLPPRQVAVLILRDVLGFHANEVAEMLHSTVDAVNSALKRGRAGLRRRQRTSGTPPLPLSPDETAIVENFVRAYQSADVQSVVALLTDDVFISMPPMPFEYEGREAAAAFCGSIFGAGRRFELLATRANGQPAFGTYLKASDGTRRGVGLLVLTLSGDRISAMTRFEGTVLPWFGLPRSLPAR